MKRSLGVCYYPEHWPEPQWAKDAARMVDAGLTWVRIGEFAWSRLEPAPGDLRFDWLDQAIDTLAQAGLRIVLGTPTATPPRWMLDRHPDMLACGEDGAPRKFGSRRHYCFSHLPYRAEAARITGFLGERYGADDRIAAWQIDNEYGCHDTVLSYSDAARVAFRGWLQDRYGTIDALNIAWGNVFWSMEYQRFDQIDLPDGTVTQANPAHLLAFRRFSADQVAAFNRAQVDTLRPMTQAPLIHNYMGRILEFDHFAVGDTLDIASWDSYPIGFLSDRLTASVSHKEQYLRQGDPDMQAFHHDLYRAVGKGRWWVMEQQPGPVNWAPYNPAPLPGMVRLWTWEAFAHGAETVSYFRWRQAPFAQEQMHSGLLRIDGAPAPALDEIRAVTTELDDLPDVATGPSEVALVFDYGSDWAWKALPHGADFDYFELVFSAYQALRRAGFSIDVVPPDHSDFDAYYLVLAPGLGCAPTPLLTALEQTTATVLLGPRSLGVTADLSLVTPLPPNLSGLDMQVTRVESLPPGHAIAMAGGGAAIRWFEHLETTTAPQFQDLHGAPVVVAGEQQWYLGAWPDQALWDRIIAALAMSAGLRTQPMPNGLRRRRAGDEMYYFNYNAHPIDWAGTVIGPADMLVQPAQDNA